MATEQIEDTAAAINHVAESGRSSGEVDEVTLLELLAIVAKRKSLILRVTIAAAVVAAVISFLIPNRYTATTSLLPPQQPQSLASALASQLGGAGSMLGAVAGGSGLGLKNPNDIYIGMLKSRIVNDALIKRFDLMKVYRDKRMSDARKDLQDATDIQSVKEGFITVSVEDKDRKRAADMANAYVEELRKLTSYLAITEAGQRRLFFEQQLRKAKDDLANAEVAMKETQQKTGLIQMDGQAKAIIESVARIRAQVAAKEVELQAMQFSATDQNPDLLRVREQLAGLRVQSAKLERQQNAGGGDIQIPTGSVPEAGLQYIRRLRDVKYYETIFELLAKQLEVSKLDEARQGAVIQVVDPAVEPDKKSYPKRSLIIIAAILIVFFGAVVWALVADSIERMKCDPEQLHQLTRVKQFLSFQR